MNRLAVCSLLFVVGALPLVCCHAAGSVDDWVRYFEARNIVANRAIASPAADAVVEKPDLTIPEQLVKMICPVCDGKGEVVQHAPDYGQWDGRLNRGKSVRKVCPVCRRRKYWMAHVQPTELAKTAAMGRAKFETAHRLNGDAAVGQAFVSRELYSSIPRKDLKQVEEAYGRPCQLCSWTGVVPCKSCKGNGVIGCKSKDCKEGWVVTKSTAALGTPGDDSFAMEDSADDAGYESSIFAVPAVPMSACGNSGSCPKSRCKNSCVKTTVIKVSGGSTYSHSNNRSRSHHNLNRKGTVTVDECPLCDGAGCVMCPDCNGVCAVVCSKCNGVGVKQKR